MGGERVFSHTFKCETATANAIRSYRRFVDEVPPEISALPLDSLLNRVIMYIYASDPLMVNIRRMGEKKRHNGSMFTLGYREPVWNLLDHECACAYRLNAKLLTEYAFTQFVRILEDERCFPEDFLVY